MRFLELLAVVGRLLLFAVIGKALLVAVNATGLFPERWLQAALPALGAESAAWVLAALAGVCLYALELKARSPARGVPPDVGEAPLGLRMAWPQDHAQSIKGFPPEH